MDRIVVEGVQPYDGRWDFDLVGRELTTREWGWIKRLAGYLPVDLDEKELGDPELITVFAAIALRRAGRIEAREVPQAFERLSDAPFGSAITLETEEAEEDDAGPPPPSSSENGDVSGAFSTPRSETSEPSPRASGTPASATSESGPPTSVT